MRTASVIKYSLFALLVICLGLFLHYNLPRTEVVRITGTDVKRIDRGSQEQSQLTRDVRYINSVTRSGKVKVFRNEDTGWGWPPYLKFDSADQTAKAQMVMQNPDKQWVRVRYYGWRIQVFSLFPNAVSIKVVDRDYTHIPVFNILFFVLLAAGIVLLVRLGRALKERMDRKMSAKSDAER